MVQPKFNRDFFRRTRGPRRKQPDDPGSIQVIQNLSLDVVRRERVKPLLGGEENTSLHSGEGHHVTLRTPTNFVAEAERVELFPDWTIEPTV